MRYTRMGLATLLSAALTSVLLAGCGAGTGDEAAPVNKFSAAAAPPQGTEQAFAVLGGSTVTNTGSSVITGNLGVSPGAVITGFPPGIVTGVTHAADAVALQAQTDTTAAYIDLASQALHYRLDCSGSRWEDAHAGRLLLFELRLS